MPPLLLALIVITCGISIYGFQNQAFFEKYKFNVGAIQSRKEYIRLLSAGFLHGDFMHLFFNMFTLYFFAPIVMSAFGEIGFLVVYFGSILLGNLFSLYIYKHQSYYSAIGASGGVSGILFAAIAAYPHIGIGIMFIPLPIPGYIFGALYFAYSVYMMLNPKQWDNLGHAAHLGGAGFGLLYAIVFHLDLVLENAMYLGIMSLPLVYLAYQIFTKKKIG
ncbi:rhomboid family intramembrane serine protease [Soonwooa sp.]|uniref:rhomboid family intramembrane serine protease n=1 Tax=Soonwooa sp. TaxID=1938592 RepID=UPI0028A1FBD2|nr:rhomboid family intramembrane serine protease [Soonwooa sp.]